MALPISESQAKKACAWMKKNFTAEISAAIAGTQWTIDLVCAIACQETAFKWVRWITEFTPETVLMRCVFDASGDYPGTSRSAFPVNRKAFEKVYGSEITEMLVSEGNKQRAMPQPDAPKGYNGSLYLYKGYGIFQNDLQNIKSNPEFFLEKQWYSMESCCRQLVVELNKKAAVNKSGELRETVRRYNGAGSKAEAYADNVMEFINISKSVG